MTFWISIMHSAMLYFSVSVQISKALEYCHKRSIAHLDVKPANILVIKEPQTGSAVFKLADFGCSKRIADGCSKLYDVVGTPGYQARQSPQS